MNRSLAQELRVSCRVLGLGIGLKVLGFLTAVIWKIQSTSRGFVDGAYASSISSRVRQGRVRRFC